MRKKKEQIKQNNYQLNALWIYNGCAPESLRRQEFSSSSDVWMFGVTVWEIFTLGIQNPWHGLSVHEILKALEERGERLQCPDICPPSIYSLLLLCWSLSPNDRPKFSKISSLLNQCRPVQYRVTHDNKQINQITLVRGDTVSVFDSHVDKPIWKGQNHRTQKVGCFPRNCLSSITKRTNENISWPVKGSFIHTGHSDGSGEGPSWGKIDQIDETILNNPIVIPFDANKRDENVQMVSNILRLNETNQNKPVITRAPPPIPKTPTSVSEIPPPVSKTSRPISKTPPPVSKVTMSMSKTSTLVSKIPTPVSDTPSTVPKTPISVSKAPTPISENPITVSGIPPSVPRTSPPIAKVPIPMSKPSTPISNAPTPVSGILPSVPITSPSIPKMPPKIANDLLSIDFNSSSSEKTTDKINQNNSSEHFITNHHHHYHHQLPINNSSRSSPASFSQRRFSHSVIDSHKFVERVVTGVTEHLKNDFPALNSSKGGFTPPMIRKFTIPYPSDPSSCYNLQRQ